jgi:PAS domain S-box-containing protein
VGRLTLLNRAAERMLGYSAAEVVGKQSATIFLRVDELTARLETLKSATGTPGCAFMALADPKQLGSATEWTICRKDGSEFPARVTTTAMYDEDGNLTGYTAVASDITPIKQAEESLRCSQEALQLANGELARALSFRNEFLASMSHELRTPLAAILNLTEALTDYVQGPLNPHQLTYIQTISESSRHLLNVINDILDIAKIEAGHMQLDLEPVSVEAVCYACMRLIREQAKRKNLTPTLDIDLEVTTLRVDERRLKQMLVNLLGNAVKFTPGGGAFGLEVRGDRATQRVRFAVWDTGIGIGPDELPHLFQPFMQVGSAMARQQEGAGLGLALVRRMAELHGGHIDAESEPGHGSRFTVVLPWDEETEEETRLAIPEVLADGTLATPGQNDSHAVILLVEDNEATSLAIRDYLALRGYRVYHARDGLEALNTAREINPDLILLDVQMPALDGFETVRRLRQIDELQSVTVVALTALVMRGDRERCLAAGMDDYISKPISLHKLVQIIERNVGVLKRSKNAGLHSA